MKTSSSTGCLVLLALWPVAAVWSGFALMKLWGWFVVPTFHLPSLSLPVAIGLSAIAHYLNHAEAPTPYDEGDEGSEIVLKTAVFVFTKPAYTLVFGWLVSRFL